MILSSWMFPMATVHLRLTIFFRESISSKSAPRYRMQSLLVMVTQLVSMLVVSILE